jgi:chromosomal replication initiator protein
VAIYLARKYTDQPLQAIGKSFNRYHGTALHSIAAVEKGIRSDGSLKKQLEFLCERIESH